MYARGFGIDYHERARSRRRDRRLDPDLHQSAVSRVPLSRGSVMSDVHEGAESDQVQPGQLAPDAAGAIRFLECWMEGSEPRSLLVSIVPDSPTTHGHTFDLPGDAAMAQWIERSNRVAGVYWTVNTCKPDLMKKATKASVERLLGIWADLDPIKGRGLASERDRFTG
jgi:hypothetical protein